MNLNAKYSIIRNELIDSWWFFDFGNKLFCDESTWMWNDECKYTSDNAQHV